METLTNLDMKSIEVLNELVVVNRDNAKGLREVAEHTNTDSVRQTFREIARERDSFSDELQHVLEQNGLKAQEGGKLAAKCHRWWIKWRALAQPGSTTAMLNEAERGEDSIKDCYETALYENPGMAASQLLHKQLNSVKHAHDRIRELRDLARAGLLDTKTGSRKGER